MSLVVLLITTASNASNYPEHSKDIKDWRKSGTLQEQVKALVKVTPGTHHWMTEIAYRYQSLYWAVQQNQWEFANYQVASMEKMIKRVANARAKRGPSVKTFRENVFPQLYRAMKTKDKAVFNKAFAITGAECMACHAKENHAFITVPSIPPRPNSIVLGDG